MKNYFSFNLTGKKLLPIWLLYLAFVIAPYVSMIFKISHIGPEYSPPMLIILLVVLVAITVLVVTFYIAKLSIEHINFKDKSIQFTGTFGKFIGKFLLGYFLSIITLGVYMAWFMRDIHRFFIDNSTYDSHSFKFQGKAGKLFVILLLTLIVPMILLFVVMAEFMIGNSEPTFSLIIIQQIVYYLILIPYMYLVYKWMVNVDYKEFNISWKTDFWSSCGKIAVEMILSIITLGIYGPLAMVRLYKYFTDRTFADSDEKKFTFGYDIDQLNDFLFIWGQILLTIITLGVYYSWAFCKIGNRLLSKTYIQED